MHQVPGDVAAFSLLVALRLVNALCVRTFFQPDEYFQALEPAWAIAFGRNSGAWLTWEWQYQLRSSLHPALFGGVYVVLHNVMQLLQLPPQLASAVLVAAPKAVQAVFAALGDYYTWKLAEKIHSPSRNTPLAALWLTVINPWQWYCSTRTFSNSIETTLTVMALYHWPWDLLGDTPRREAANKADTLPSTQELRTSLLLAALAVLLRPTNLLIWLAVLTLTVTRLGLDGRPSLSMAVLARLGSEIVLCGAFALGISLLADRFYFGFWTFPPYQWLHFNISKSLAVFYGRNDWHYYLSQGIPLLTTTCLPFALIGLYTATGLGPGSNALTTLSFAVLTTIGALSTISHKEVRFIYPLLPLLHVIAAPHASSFFLRDYQPPSSSPDSRQSSSPRFRLKWVMSLMLLINAMLAGYLSLLHQPAPLSVLHFLRGEYERVHPDSLEYHPRAAISGPGDAAPLAPGPTGPQHARSEADELFALFLTPCHSTPWRSHLVYAGLRARALTCEPPLDTEPGTSARDDYMDEADRFYADTAAFLARELFPTGAPAGALEIPRYIVGFEGVEAPLLRFFDRDTGEGGRLGVELRRVWEGWNGYFNEDRRRRGLLVVWETGI